MRIEVQSFEKGNNSISQADFENFNLPALMSSLGSIILQWSNGKADTLNGPIALYLSEIKLWANRVLSSDQETCLEIHMTPFLYGTRLGNNVELSYYSKTIEPEHDRTLIEITSTNSIEDCLNYIEQKIAEYAEYTG